MDDTQISKFLSYVLRHRPDSIGLTPDTQGWVQVADLLRLAAAHGRVFSEARLREVVANNDKQRFTLQGGHIRAAQGHSAPQIAIAHRVCEPPPVLFHGTVARFLPAIRTQGLRAGTRHHVHLSGDYDTAVKVGQRRGKAVVLRVDAAAMRSAGYVFYRADNGVWLADGVPPDFLKDFP